MEDYSKYTNEQLVQMMTDSYDLDESVFFVLSELSNRKHPRTKEFCMNIINMCFERDEYLFSSAFDDLYSIDEDEAIEYAKENHTKFHIYSIGKLLSLLWVDASIANENPKKIELIKILKKDLKKKNSKELVSIKEDYDEFIKAYN